MGNEEKQRYSAEELKEFEQIILEKLEDSRSELTYLRETLSNFSNFKRFSFTISL